MAFQLFCNKLSAKRAHHGREREKERSGYDKFALPPTTNVNITFLLCTINPHLKFQPIVQNDGNLATLIPHDWNDDNWQEIDDKEICNYSFLKASFETLHYVDAINENVARVNLSIEWEAIQLTLLLNLAEIGLQAEPQTAATSTP